MISEILGWSYFLAWSLSFWPQIMLNFQRKRVDGLSHDFVLLNLLGFACYSIYNTSFYVSPFAQKQYRARWGSDNPIALNDVAFSLHALFMCITLYVQTCIYPRHDQPKASYLTFAFIASSVVSTLALIVIVRAHIFDLQLLDVLYLLSFIKIAVTFIKYIPQTILNFTRKSTIGWSIENILFDFTGGALSIAQVMVDSSVSNDWTVITGNPVKFGLGSFSLIFDVIFMVQHYIIYPQHRSFKSVDPSDTSENERLLSNGSPI